MQWRSQDCSEGGGRGKSNVSDGGPTEALLIKQIRR